MRALSGLRSRNGERTSPFASSWKCSSYQDRPTLILGSMGMLAAGLSLHTQNDVVLDPARDNPAGGSTVLVADDDPSVRRLVTLAFELDGFSVVSAADGREALECALSLRPAAAVLDAVMPHLDGMEVSRRMRRSSAPGRRCSS